MPIRGRPEAGFLLALASGRLPPRRRGGGRMTRLRRRPREVYRVYTEDEYLGGAGLEVATVGEWPPAAEPARKGAGERRLRRAAGMAMLAGTVGAVGGLVVMTGSWAHRGAGRRPGSLVAATRSPRGARSPAVADSSAAPSWPVGAHRSLVTRSRVVLAGRRRAVADIRLRGERHGGSDAHLPKRVRRGNRVGARSAGPGVTRGGGVAVVVDYVPRSSAGEAPATSASAGAAAPRAAAGKQAEFGFER
jgi:hypothetical protein